MKIKKLSVQNFRRFEGTDIFFSKDITLLAGANNSGKTSLVQLFNWVFSEKKTGYIGAQDLSLSSRNKITRTLLSYLDEEMRNNNSNNEQNNTIGLIDDFFAAEIDNIPIHLKAHKDVLKRRYITIKIEIEYKEGDYIGLFSDYLMNLDSNNRSFYFMYQRKVDPRKFRNLLEKHRDDIRDKWYAYSSTDNENDEEQENDSSTAINIKSSLSSFESILMDIYEESLDDFYYYSDKEYKLIEKMSSTSFRKLFHYDYLPANRGIVDDGSSKSLSLVNNIVDYISKPAENYQAQGGGNTKEPHKEWKEYISKLSNNLKSIFQQYPEINRQINETVKEELSNISKELKRVGESEISQIFVQPQFTTSEAESIIKNYFKVFYNVTSLDEEMEIFLEEDSQGLGVSNLICITIDLLKYKKEYRHGAVNFFIIEEPEAHLHPQMQQVLIDYLQDEFFNDEKQIQSLVTTHSNKIVKTSFIENIKVIRAKQPYINAIIDMEDFLAQLEQGSNNERKFFETLFNINFSNLIFADKVILYEGDTERMYIESLLYKNKHGKRQEGYLGNLRRFYIAYAQVGGAYAHKYNDLLRALDTKALIFTDLDYYDKAVTLKQCLESKTTNHTLKHYYEVLHEPCQDLKIKDILKWKKELQGQLTQKNIPIFCKTQNANDGYARTLEEALLYQYLINFEKIEEVEEEDLKYENITSRLNEEGLQNINVFTKFDRSFWQEIKTVSKLEFPIPNRTKQELEDVKNTDEILISIRRIVKSIASGKKTDFMYSIILNDLQEKIMPAYIEEGLRWLETETEE